MNEVVQRQTARSLVDFANVQMCDCDCVDELLYAGTSLWDTGPAQPAQPAKTY